MLLPRPHIRLERITAAVALRLFLPLRQNMRHDGAPACLFITRRCWTRRPLLLLLAAADMLIMAAMRYIFYGPLLFA